MLPPSEYSQAMSPFAKLLWPLLAVVLTFTAMLKLASALRCAVKRRGNISIPTNCTILYKKAVLSQRRPRDARYVSRSWAVAEIWSFEIIQDGGGRHLEFVRIENSSIRPVVPENPTLEQNMKWIGRPVAVTWNFSKMAVAAILDLFEP